MSEAGKENFASWKQNIFKIRHSVVDVGLGCNVTRECGRETHTMLELVGTRRMVCRCA